MAADDQDDRDRAQEDDPGVEPDPPRPPSRSRPARSAIVRSGQSDGSCPSRRSRRRASSTYDSESPPRPANVSRRWRPCGREHGAVDRRSASRPSRPRGRRAPGASAGRRRPGRPCRSAAAAPRDRHDGDGVHGQAVAAVAVAATSSIATGSGWPASATTSRAPSGTRRTRPRGRRGEQRLDPVEVDPLAEQLGEPRPATDHLEQPGIVLPGQVAGAQLAQLRTQLEVGNAVGVAHHHVRSGVDELADVLRMRRRPCRCAARRPGPPSRSPPGATRRAPAAGRPSARWLRSGRTSRRAPSPRDPRAPRAARTRSGASRPPAWVTWRRVGRSGRAGGVEQVERVGHPGEGRHAGRRCEVPQPARSRCGR